MENLFGNIKKDKEEFTLFQDEAGCSVSNYFYHGFLLVRNDFGRSILKKILEIKGSKSRESEITFKEIKKDDYRVKIATQWLEQADKWFQEGKIRFYVLGVNKNNLKNFWDNSWRFEKNVYLRFFDIGINSAIGWFCNNDKSMNKPLVVSHIFYEYGPYNDERENKISWLKSLQGYKHTEPVHSNSKNQRKLNAKLYELSNLIQFTDVLLGVTKYSFIRINENHIGRQKCVNNFLEIVERFNGVNAYNPRSRYYKRYSLGFFPTASDITKTEFLSNDFIRIRKRGGFYNTRPTYRQFVGQKNQQSLF